MTDLSRVLPGFPVGEYGSLIPALERHGVTTTDLLALDAAELGKRTQLPLLDVRRLCDAVLRAIHVDLGVPDSARDDGAGSGGSGPTAAAEEEGVGHTEAHSAEHAGKASKAGKATSSSSGASKGSGLKHSPAQLASRWSTISTLDPVLDEALGGGIPAGFVTEITGESGAGKTQLLLSLLLAVQLPAPHGLSRPAIYISTEAALSTRRLAQMLSANPLVQSVPPKQRPSLDSIFTLATPDLESQDHILTFQVPVEAARRNIGLVVLDSVAANFRAEFERGRGGGGSSASSSSNNMGARTAELVRLGMQLRELARVHNLAVVVANQVADRFGARSPRLQQPPLQPLHALPPTTPGGQFSLGGRMSQESPLAARSRQHAPEPPSSMLPRSSLAESMGALFSASVMGRQQQQPDIPALVLDHQQRWFTGWGDEEKGRGLMAGELKTPSLGLVWTTQISARIALLKRPAYGRRPGVSGGGGGDSEDEEEEEEDEEDDEEKGGGGDVATMTPLAGLQAPKTWRRWMKVVFAPYAAPSGPGLDGAAEFEITIGGLRGLPPRKRKKKRQVRGEAAR